MIKFYDREKVMEIPGNPQDSDFAKAECDPSLAIMFDDPNEVTVVSAIQYPSNMSDIQKECAGELTQHCLIIASLNPEEEASNDTIDLVESIKETGGIFLLFNKLESFDILLKQIEILRQNFIKDQEKQEKCLVNS